MFYLLSRRRLTLVLTGPSIPLYISLSVYVYACIPSVKTECREYFSSPVTVCPTLIRLSGSSGTFTSLRFPEPYPSNLECTWQITVSKTRHMTLSFDSFSVQHCVGCGCDYVKIIDSTVVRGWWCGENEKNVPEVMSSSETLEVRFVTNGDTQFKGFRAKFEENPLISKFCI